MNNKTNKSKQKIVISIEPEIKDLIPKYLARRQQDLRSLSESLDKNDFDSIQLIGHTMKGSGGGYGFEHLSEIGQALELAGEKADAPKARKSIDDLADFLDRVEVIFE